MIWTSHKHIKGPPSWSSGEYFVCRFRKRDKYVWSAMLKDGRVIFREDLPTVEQAKQYCEDHYKGENMRTEHTPGPWNVIEPDRTRPSRIGVGAGQSDIYTGIPLTSETRANAKLIAAAPDLLRALKGAQGVLEAVKLANPPDEISELLIELQTHTEKVIKQAEGS